MLLLDGQVHHDTHADPHGELRDRGGELRDRYPLRAGELHERRQLAQLCGRLPLALRITADRAASLRHLSVTDLVDELTLEHRAPGCLGRR